MGKYALGLDYGTLSGRAVLADVSDGRVVASASRAYPHGVMSEALPQGAPLPPDWALHHPMDYLNVLEAVVPEALKSAGVSPGDVVGIGLDATASTVLPVTREGVPLCCLEAFVQEKHAYAKLWKHHAAQPYADRLTELARARGEEWLSGYGGRVSSEWCFPKLWQVLEEAPDVYEAMDEWMEAADWLALCLTGNRLRNACCAGYKAFYAKGRGFPAPDYFACADRRLKNVIADKMRSPVRPHGSFAGGLTRSAAEKLGLRPGTPVALGCVDAHACVPASGINRPGQMLLIMGTSSCHMTLSRTDARVPGTCGAVEDGMLPGFFGCEAGQSCAGDHFDWFANRCVPAPCLARAQARGLDIQQYLTLLAQRLRPGESGLLALDWWNGNRSVLEDARLSGLLVGMTLQTKPEEIYRALIEATAYGTRVIVENFRAHGVPVDTVIASGGISQKNELAMRIYADVLNMPVCVADSAIGSALGSAMYGAGAAGRSGGGWDGILDALAPMHARIAKTYTPCADGARAYDQLYAEYRRLHDYFGRGGSFVMKRLREMRARPD